MFIIPKIGSVTSIIVPAGHWKSMKLLFIIVLLQTTEDPPKLPRDHIFRKAFGLGARAFTVLFEYTHNTGKNANVMTNIILKRLSIISKYALTPYPRIMNGLF